jgi:hypothetical protein
LRYSSRSARPGYSVRHDQCWHGRRTPFRHGATSSALAVPRCRERSGAIRIAGYGPVSDPLAIYAAAVGTISLGWNVRQGLRSERVDVQVMVVTEPILVLPEKDRPAPYNLTVIARNSGATEERVDQIGIRYLDPSPLDIQGAQEFPAGERNPSASTQRHRDIQSDRAALQGRTRVRRFRSARIGRHGGVRDVRVRPDETGTGRRRGPRHRAKAPEDTARARERTRLEPNQAPARESPATADIGPPGFGRDAGGTAHACHRVLGRPLSSPRREAARARNGDRPQPPRPSGACRRRASTLGSHTLHLVAFAIARPSRAREQMQSRRAGLTRLDLGGSSHAACGTATRRVVRSASPHRPGRTPSGC